MQDKSKYETPTAFKSALETRLKARAKQVNRPYPTLRKLVAFDRLLARIFTNQDNSFALKGGYSLELRLGKSRTTKDVDLILQNPVLLKQTGSAIGEELKALLQEKLDQHIEDFFSFRLGKATEITIATLGGYRIKATALLGGTFFDEFHLDIAIAETDPSPLEELTGESWLEFAGIDAAKPLAIPQELQFAEKLHAYTHIREGRENTREKDLIDMVILVQRGIDPIETAKRMQAVFAARSTHALPEELNPPPQSWGNIFAKHAEELDYPGTLEDAYQTVKRFFSDELLNTKSD